ncbi:NUDIX domain-containing protein, partial [Streptomyces sp. NPDC001948]
GSTPRRSASIILITPPTPAAAWAIAELEMIVGFDDDLAGEATHDMFVGGVVGAGESYDQAALREAEEELGVSGLPRPEPLFKFLYESAEHSWWSYVYQVRCELPVNPQVEEVDWYAFLTDDELARRIGDWEWVPDGVEAYHRLRAFRAGA